MNELKEKFACFKVDKIEDRCMKVTNYEGETFPSLNECMKNCNTPEEQEKLDKLKEHFRLKTTVEFIRPELIKTFDQMIDLPILNFEGKIYNRKLLNFEEIKMLYVILNIEKLNLKHENLFLEDIVKSLNGQIGLNMTTTIVDTYKLNLDYRPAINTKIPIVLGLPQEIIYKIDFDKNYAYHFLSDEYKELFDKEIKSFYESTNIYLIKNVIIDKFDREPGHHTQLLIKKNITSGKTKLEVFIYDPVSNGIINPISEKIEEFLNAQIKYEHSIFNLSKIYGIQDFEKGNGDDYMKMIIKNVDVHINSITDVLKKIVVDLKSVYLEYKKTNIPFSPKAFTKFIIDKFLGKLFERHFLMNDIKNFIRQLIDTILSNEKIYLEDESNNIYIFDSPFADFFSKLRVKHDNLIKEISILFSKRLELEQKINNQYNFDFFEGNCYLWSYYTVILILINPTIQPYDIIKASFYQSSKVGRMQKLFEGTLENIDYIKNQTEYAKKMFDQDYIKNENLKLEKYKKKVEENKLNVDLLEHTRLVYIKITNLILINILYNRLQNKYLLYKIQEGCQQEYCEKKMIPEKVNEILDKLSFDGTKLTKESILKIVKTGKKINDINSAILKDKSTVPSDYKEIYYEPRIDPMLAIKPKEIFLKKYLKYKKKYLQLKNLFDKN
jgi:hypothetical protein